MLHTAGLDAVAFVRMHLFGVQLFTLLALFALPLILPLNYRGYYSVEEAVNFPEKEWDLR